MISDTYSYYGIELIRTALCANPLSRTDINAGKATIEKTALARALLPYLFVDIEPGWLLPVNRDYKPIGLMVRCDGMRGWADYPAEKYRSLLLPVALVDLTLLRRLHGWYLYDDSNAPFHDGWSTTTDRAEYHLKLWWSLRHFNIPPPRFNKTALSVAKRLGIDVFQREVPTP